MRTFQEGMIVSRQMELIPAQAHRWRFCVQRLQSDLVRPADRSRPSIARRPPFSSMLEQGSGGGDIANAVYFSVLQASAAVL